jgi:hypothetical protein
MAGGGQMRRLIEEQDQGKTRGGDLGRKIGE